MSAMAILSELQRRGVTVIADGDALVLKPGRAIDNELLARVREHKPEIMRALSAHPATCAASCYGIEPGRWIHHPWDWCTTVKPEASGSQRKLAVTCWHCHGEKKCTCGSCWQARPGDCVTCKARGQVWRWVQ